MDSQTFSFLLCSLLFFSLLNRTFAVKKSYIVYLGGHYHGREPTSLDTMKAIDFQHQLLSSCLGSWQKATDSIFYSYTNCINGFAANLEEEEANEISKNPNVISVFLNKGAKLHTTRSWEFLGLEKQGNVAYGSIWQKARYGEDTIIGSLDTGVWPESKSFVDEGMGPVPTRWRGGCYDNSKNPVRCNRKLIGAKYFNKGYQSIASPLNDNFMSPRDTDGHGTHTLSTAAGRFVQGASIFGYGNGTSKGGSPSARVASYKVCWPPYNGNQCTDADILAAFDAAIQDGVDVLSVSVGSAPKDYFTDAIAIGSFHAVQNGIVVVCSGGNDGPAAGSVSNTAPWIFTVAASTLDREFPSYLQLGNKTIFKGVSLSEKALPANMYFPLVSSVEAKSLNSTNENASLCYIGSLDPEKVKGKIVACLRGDNARTEKGEAVLKAGGVGMVLLNDEANGNGLNSDAHVLPATHISYSDGLSVLSYIKSTKFPVASITKVITQIPIRPAPYMASFSSQGPNQVTPEILKPDITAPGVDVLASYTEASSPTDLIDDLRRVPFNVESGTSMSCPHVSGVVGLLKTLHPDWSPSAIRSAIMTTARTRDNTGKPILDSFMKEATPFHYGSGHVRPNKAMDPGLVYDLTPNDYLNFLCNLGYTSKQISSFSRTPYSCPSKPSSILDFNYPSISIPHLSNITSVTRTLKNVGSPGTYTVHVVAPRGIMITVEPKSLSFSNIGEEKKFKVTFEPNGTKDVNGHNVFGRLIWSDGVHYVRSPIAVKTDRT